jgi:CubicO group peptidase (beta-lactamase class C family)
MKYSNPIDAGFSPEKLSVARDFFNSTNAVSLMLIKNGNVVVAWGDVQRRYKCHSVRKSLLNSLYGVGIKLNFINIDKTIGEIGITEKVELLESEKLAKVKHLLSMSSGVYLDAALQPDVGGSPSRGSFKPGVNQYYNNWDFNVLGTIYNLECRSDVFWDFKKYIADPIGMQDYRIIDGTYEFEETSLHPGYPFKMSTRDLAKFGQLYLQQGNWNGKQIFDTSWIKQSLTPFQVVENTGNAATGYGYLWWIQERIGEHKRYFALGWGEQYLGIFPDNDIVIVLRADSYSGEYFIEEHRERLINLLLNANMSEPNSNPKLELLKLNENKSKRILLTNDILSKYIGNYRFEQSNLSEINADFTIKMYENGELIIENLHYAYKFELIPLSLDRFYIEDIGLYLKFEKDQIDNELRPIITKE